MKQETHTFLEQAPAAIQTVTLSAETDITMAEYIAVVRHYAKLEFSQSFIDRVNRARGIIEGFLEENRLIYGVTTGFGENVRVVIPPEEASELQHNIVRSHAASVGEPLCEEMVRAIQLQMILNTGGGYSGISLGLISLIRDMLNKRVIPYAPGEGSVGYLGVEGHFTLVLMGEGKAWYQGELMSGKEALEAAGLSPRTLGCKEGLSLLNGSTSVTAIGVLALYDAIVTAKTLDIAGCMSFEALKATILGCDERLHSVKQHAEQRETARIFRDILKDSQIMAQYKDARVQDPYALRCTPQVHGAGKRLIRQAYESVWEEVCSVSDNPIVYPGENGAEDVALMGGNFDGTYVGAA
ncbi:MAG: aromatic amino acid ammonia-lyase, partial [Oscillospiraceae bacterium]|nr:aromatic amino acid ammonia-lyase [Oscillospiraceae bacterium]